MKIQKFSKLFEADIKNNMGVPTTYLTEVDRIAAEKFGSTGPNREEMGRAGFLFHNIMRIQYGNEDKLTEIGKQIIMDEYGDILDGVKLDIKIVRPGDSEQLKMVDKLQKEKGNKKPKIETIEFNKKVETPIEEIDKSKVLNNIMQGEAQNVQNLMYYKKEDIDKINSNYLNYLVEFFNINKKFDWKEGINMEEPMEEHPEMANVSDTDYEEGEEGEEVPVIKVRALDLQMLIHETIKGVYSLIMAHSIPDDPELAQSIKNATASFSDENQDVKYGPFIAADIRDYIMGYIDRKYEHKTKDIKNIKEFVYGKMAALRADIFIDLVYFILNKEMNKADSIMNTNKIVEEILEDINGESEDYEDTYNGTGNYLQKDDEFDETGYADEDEPKEVQTWKQFNTETVSGPEEDIKKLKSMTDSEAYAYLKSKTSPPQRMKIIDQALDDSDYAIVKLVSDFNNKNK